MPENFATKRAWALPRKRDKNSVGPKISH